MMMLIFIRISTEHINPINAAILYQVDTQCPRKETLSTVMTAISLLSHSLVRVEWTLEQRNVLYVVLFVLFVI